MGQRVYNAPFYTVYGVVEVNASDAVQVSNDMPNLDAGSKERTGACTLQGGLCRGIF